MENNNFNPNDYQSFSGNDANNASVPQSDYAWTQSDYATPEANSFNQNFNAQPQQPTMNFNQNFTAPSWSPTDAKDLFVKGCLAIGGAVCPGFLGFVFGAQGRKLRKEYIEHHGSISGLAKVGGILSNIGFWAAIPMTILYAISFITSFLEAF